MTDPAAAAPAPTATIKLPVAGGDPITVTMPQSLVDSPNAIAVARGRVWQRNAKGQYVDVSANAHVDPTGTAERADVADLRVALADFEAREKDAAAVIADAKGTITKLVSDAKAIPADVKKEAEGIVARFEHWIKGIV